MDRNTESNRIIETEYLPTVPLRGMNTFPGAVFSFDVARSFTVGSVEKAAGGDKRLFCVMQRDASMDKVARDDLYDIGTVVRIRQTLKMPGDMTRVLAEGITRARLVEYLDMGAFAVSGVYTIAEEKTEFPSIEDKAKQRVLKNLMLEAFRDKVQDQELRQLIRGENDTGMLCDIAAANFLTEPEKKQKILETIDVEKRCDAVLLMLAEEKSIQEVEQKIHNRVHEQIENANHEYYLREEIRAIQKELGDDEDEDVRELRKRISESHMPEDARKAAEKELSRLARTAVNTPESGVSINYLEFMLSLPWDKSSGRSASVKTARAIFERDHYGMREVKDRLLEHLAVMELDRNIKSPVICLVGPPGVGKTSIARSVAEALGRSFCRMSLGGVHDEAEIRGHRRTYVGAMPGHILSAIETCGENDPVFLLDEIDKMTRDMRGDPASALLEALDPEQNSRFRDHYLDTPFDLSKVLFITTANSLEPIDRALLDRMEIIHVDSYTLEDKLRIASRHLIPRQKEKHALPKSALTVTNAAVKAVVQGYTHESGVRELERMIQKICRRAALKLAEDKELTKITVRDRDLKEYLGAPRYIKSRVAKDRKTGCVNGLAWTETGGEVMPIEVMLLPGKGRTEFTGMLGDVMKESCKLAVMNVRKRLKAYGLDEDLFEKNDLHVHVPEGAVPKDGPSAGAALTCAILSAVTQRPARRDIAMTGEVTLLGDVLPIGGVKEKLLAAYREGIFEILLPQENERDLEKIDMEEREKLTVHLIGNVDEAIGYILGEKA